MVSLTKTASEELQSKHVIGRFGSRLASWSIGQPAKYKFDALTMAQEKKRNVSPRMFVYIVVSRLCSLFICGFEHKYAKNIQTETKQYKLRSYQ